MTRDFPRFDEPNYTVAAATLFADAAPSIPDGGELPTLREPEPDPDPDPAPVLNRRPEPLVRVEHRRIRLLSSYWHAGWTTAIASTWLRAGVSERLAAVADSLPDRWGLAIFDAWRPIELQRQLYDAAAMHPDLEPGFMALPSDDPASPPPHVCGGAVDLTLTLDGTPIASGTGFDDMTERARAAFFEDIPGPARQIRRALFHAMVSQDFVINEREWWHFEYGTRRWAAITGRTPLYGPTSPSL